MSALDLSLVREKNGTPVIWRRAPLASDVHSMVVFDGATIADVVASVPPEALPIGWSDYGIVTVNGEIVPREWWRLVRLKPHHPDRPVIVNLAVSIGNSGGAGGGGGGGKSTLATVATVAVLVAATVASAGLLGPVLGAGFAAGTWGATLLSAGVAVGGSLAIAALTPPPSLATQEALGQTAGFSDSRQGTASLSANTLRRGGPLPRVLGTRRVYPPLVAYPLVDIDGDDEVAEAVFGLAGAHSFDTSTLKNGETPIDNIDEIEYQTKEGHSTDTALTLVTRYGRTDQLSIELSRHIADKSNGERLEDQSVPLNSCPKWHSARVINSPDEIWFTLAWPSGMINTDNPTARVAVPVRVRFRAVGATTWQYVPEIHFLAQKGASFNKMLKFKFVTTAPSPPTAPANKAPYAAFKRVPMRVDRTIGNFLTPEDAFNGDVTAGAAQRVATAGFIGANWAHYPRAVTHCEIWPHPGEGFVTGGNTLSSIRIYGSSTSPATETSGTLLATYSGGETTSMVALTLSNPTTAYAYMWATLATSGGEMRVRALRFYDTGEFSWRASDYFETAAGSDVMSAASNGNVRRIGLYEDRAEISLQTATYPKGEYEFEIMRGQPYKEGQFTLASYHDAAADEPAGTWVVDYFKFNYSAGNRFNLAYDVNAITDTIFLPRVARVKNSTPVPTGSNLALLAVKVRNRSLDGINVVASGYCNVWNGSSFATLGVSQNPADHYYHVLTNTTHNRAAVPAAIVDVAALSAWRARCVTASATVNLVVEGRPVFEVLSAVAGCGKARPRQSDKWSVIEDRNRSADVPAQLFCSANARGFRWEKAFPRLPTGLRARYDDSSLGYIESEVIVLRVGATDDGVYEDIRYDGIVTQAAAQARAAFDLKQMELRSTFYRCETTFEHIAAIRGDTVAVQTDHITATGGGARIMTVNKSGSNVTGLVLTNTIEGAAIRIRLTDGTLVVRTLSGGQGTDTVTFSSISDPSSLIAEGCLVAYGPSSSETKSMIVHEIRPMSNMLAQITFVDEAPSLHT